MNKHVNVKVTYIPQNSQVLVRRMQARSTPCAAKHTHHHRNQVSYNCRLARRPIVF